MNILEVRNLKTYLHTAEGVVRAVDGVTFNIEKGKVFGIVGESGSGKTMTALSILKLVPPGGKIIEGEVLFNGRDLMKFNEENMRAIRGSGISMVFQEPLSALNPVFTTGNQLMESVLAHREKTNRSGLKERAMAYLKRVHIKDPDRVFLSYPHQLSGGMAQRVLIAMALINSPELVMLDEPTSALDSATQAEILDLLEEVIKKDNLSALFISHDFGVIRRMCDHLAVMHRGRVVESGDRESVFYSPKDSYTISLLESVKVLS